MRRASGATPNFLEVLGVAPVVGAWLPADTDMRDCSGAGALLGYVFWQREYGGDASVIGRDISLSGREFPILGVAPQSFFGLEPARRFDVALPVCADSAYDTDGQDRLSDKAAWWLSPIGRLKPGWSIDRASAHMREISPVIFEQTQPVVYRPDGLEKYVKNKLRVVDASSGLSMERGEYENPLWILLASTGLVLLIACANLANLLLARASVRRRELALRQAVGASRRRLVSQLLSESLLLAGLGALAGGFLAYSLSRGTVFFLSAGSALDVPLRIDWRVFSFTAGLALLTCVLFGLAPALRASKAAAADTMRGGRGSASSAERHGLRRALVVSQIALSFVLLVGALLFGQSLRNLLAAETGIGSEGVLLAEIDVNMPNAGPERKRITFDELRNRLESLPGVAEIAAVVFPPFGPSGWGGDVYAGEGPENANTLEAWFNRVGPGYFRTLETPMLAGRDFTLHDASSPRVAIINRKLAHDLFGDENPIGRNFRREARAGEVDPAFEVVGMVENTKYGNLREEQRAIAFYPIKQDDSFPNHLSFVLRARGSFADVTAGVKREMAAISPDMLVDFDVLDVQMKRSILRERLMANLSGGFGLLAAGLSALGLYGVMSYMVARRRSEIGVRMALGAERRDIRGLVFGEAGRLLLVGLVGGVAGSLALSRYAESLLFGLEPNDVTTLMLGGALLAATAAVAAAVPVRRAAGLDPAVVLRDE